MSHERLTAAEAKMILASKIVKVEEELKYLIDREEAQMQRNYGLNAEFLQRNKLNGYRTNSAKINNTNRYMPPKEEGIAAGIREIAKRYRISQVIFCDDHFETYHLPNMAEYLKTIDDDFNRNGRIVDEDPNEDVNYDGELNEQMTAAALEKEEKRKKAQEADLELINNLLAIENAKVFDCAQYVNTNDVQYVNGNNFPPLPMNSIAAQVQCGNSVYQETQQRIQRQIYQQVYQREQEEKASMYSYSTVTSNMFNNADLGMSNVSTNDTYSAVLMRDSNQIAENRTQLNFVSYGTNRATTTPLLAPSSTHLSRDQKKFNGSIMNSDMLNNGNGLTENHQNDNLDLDSMLEDINKMNTNKTGDKSSKTSLPNHLK